MTAGSARQQAIDAIAEALGNSGYLGGIVGLTKLAEAAYDVAEPLIAAAAIKSATRAQFEDAIRAGADEVTRERLAEIEAAVRADQREQDAQLAEHVSAAYPPPRCEHPEHWNRHGLNPFGALLRAQP